MPDIPSSAPPEDYDPTAEETFESTYAVFADLRAKCPVARSNAFDGFWAVTRYQDIHDILLQPELYITSVRNVVPGSSATGRRPPLHLDPPDHTPYRRAIDRALGEPVDAVVLSLGVNDTLRLRRPARWADTSACTPTPSWWRSNTSLTRSSRAPT